MGCGTGKNLVRLRQTFPGVSLTGLDLSGDMLEVARKKMAFVQSAGGTAAPVI